MEVINNQARNRRSRLMEAMFNKHCQHWLRSLKLHQITMVDMVAAAAAEAEAQWEVMEANQVYFFKL